jgi:hypothetical protein
VYSTRSGVPRSDWIRFIELELLLHSDSSRDKRVCWVVLKTLETCSASRLTLGGFQHWSRGASDTRSSSVFWIIRTWVYRMMESKNRIRTESSILFLARFHFSTVFDNFWATNRTRSSDQQGQSSY